MMNRARAFRSEEARRAAEAAALKAKRQQSEALKARAVTFAAEARKIEGLKALRLAKDAAEKAGVPDEAVSPGSARINSRREAS
jgi:hypothetical protein